MAGAPAGYRTFAAGEVLTAANVQTYLQDQVVAVYADAAAADAALASPAEGQFRILNDSDSFQRYDGSAWVNAGGGAAGSVLQVVSTTKTDTFSTASSSFTDITGFSASITPISTSSKIYVSLTLNGSNSGSSADAYQLLRDTTPLGNPSHGSVANGFYAGNLYAVANSGGAAVQMAFNYLDSPSSVSTLAYKVQCKRSANTLYVNRNGSNTEYAYSSTITLMEVAG